ncbi:hypothetical protein [Geomonas propionica]|uniref:Uncharacterized protein n=1 Tax=Geomonas propionica TaxID=2798582 RepID=A0ABS0YXH4_9BACT|nr:hypothetical protein [Geomonas propionica]MBJ6802611.1 hypothetical protein [Geomonas propionica]
MGGSAYQIFGFLDERHLEQRQIKKNIADWLLGRQRFLKPKEFKAGNMTMFEIPAEELAPLKTEFFSFLRKTMPTPWMATTGTFDYLDLDVMTIYMRGDRSTGAEDINWYLQLTFSGCAGMAQVSSDVAAHWVEIWYKVERTKIQERLERFGFRPQQNPPDEEPAVTFFPLPECGYAEFSTELQEMFIEEEEYSFHFAFDSSVEEAEPDQGLALLQRLETGFASLMSDGKCRCQLCSPDFRP